MKEILGNMILMSSSTNAHGGELCVITVVQDAADDTIMIALEATKMVHAKMGNVDDEPFGISLSGPVDDWELEDTVQMMADEQAENGVLVCVYDYLGIYEDMALGSVEIDPKHWTVPSDAENAAELWRLMEKEYGDIPF